jgi:hypothetical protein
MEKGYISQPTPLVTKEYMQGLEEVIKLVTTVLWSGQVEGERPLSLILVAPAGAGKTSVIENMECSTAKFFTDFTSREIIASLNGNQNLTHLMLGDFLSVFGHNKSTVKLSINLLSRLTGDTMRQKPWSGEEIQPKRMGFISAIPPDDLNKREVRNHVRSGGFASRFIMAKYNYSQKTIERIHQFIREGKYRKTMKLSVNIKPGSLLVQVPLAIAKDIDSLARSIKQDEIGFRAHHHLRTLACSVARMDSRNTVTKNDYEEVLHFCEFFKSEGKTI